MTLVFVCWFLSFSSSPLRLSAGCSPTGEGLTHLFRLSTALCCLSSRVKTIASSYSSIISVGSKRIVLVSSCRRQMYLPSPFFFFFNHSQIFFPDKCSILICTEIYMFWFASDSIERRPQSCIFCSRLVLVQRNGATSAVLMLLTL